MEEMKGSDEGSDDGREDGNVDVYHGGRPEGGSGWNGRTLGCGFGGVAAQLPGCQHEAAPDGGGAGGQRKDGGSQP